MRPRISRVEASYLVEVLKGQLGEMQKRQERKTKLEYEVYKLRERLRMGDNYGVFKDGLPQKRKELEQLERERFRLHSSIQCHTKLLAKYQAIAEGKPHNGTYKKLRCSELLYPEAPLIVCENGTATA